MDWLRDNWFWIVVAVFFIWMHTFGHGGHGGHGGASQGPRRGERESREAGGHHHH